VVARVLFPHALDRRESACIGDSLVSKICGGRSGVGAARNGSTRGEARLVDGSAVAAAVGVAAAE